MQELEKRVCVRCTTPFASETISCALCGLDAAASTEPLLGALLFHKYRLLRRIGVGSYATVFEAEHILRQGRVAFKILHQPHTKHPELLARFRREAIAASRLTSPLAVKVYDCGAEENLHWIALELIQGETLDERLERRALYSPEELYSLFQPACEILSEAHQKGVVHRDLKPANIVLGAPPRLLDFGLASLDGVEDESADKVSGTPRYMAPEQWKGLKFSDARSDIYSLAVIAYQCLSGELPLDADTTIAWLKKHRNEPPRDLGEVMRGRPLPEKTRATIMQALSKDPAARPQSVSAFLEGISAKGSPAEVSAPVPMITAAPQRTLPLWLKLAAAMLPFVVWSQLGEPRATAVTPASVLPAPAESPTLITQTEAPTQSVVSEPLPDVAPASAPATLPAPKSTPKATLKSKAQPRPSSDADSLQMKTINPWSP